IPPAQLSVLPLQRSDPRRIRRRCPGPHPPVDLRLLGPAAQRVRLDPQLAAHLPAGSRHAGLLILDQVQHQPDRPVTQLVRILPCCSHLPTLPWIGSLHKTRGDSSSQRAAGASPVVVCSPAAACPATRSAYPASATAASSCSPALASSPAP